MSAQSANDDERLRRWKLVLSVGTEGLSERDQRLSAALSQLYDVEDEKQKSRRIVDPTLQRILRFQLRGFSAHEAEDYSFAFRYEP